jgi:hypothetical protein
MKITETLEVGLLRLEPRVFVVHTATVTQPQAMFSVYLLCRNCGQPIKSCSGNAFEGHLLPGRTVLLV